MAEGTRSAVQRTVYARLADPDFRRRLTATSPDGYRPVIVALREDLMSEVLAELQANGGSGNVAVPLVNGVALLALTPIPPGAAGDDACVGRELRTDCTVGVFCHRVIGEAAEGDSVRYRFIVPSSDESAGSGRAELVAMA